jgi:TonB family protein
VQKYRVSPSWVIINFHHWHGALSMPRSTILISLFAMLAWFSGCGMGFASEPDTPCVAGSRQFKAQSGGHSRKLLVIENPDTDYLGKDIVGPDCKEAVLGKQNSAIELLGGGTACASTPTGISCAMLGRHFYVDGMPKEATGESRMVTEQPGSRNLPEARWTKWYRHLVGSLIDLWPGDTPGVALAYLKVEPGARVSLVRIVRFIPGADMKGRIDAAPEAIKLTRDRFYKEVRDTVSGLDHHPDLMFPGNTAGVTVALSVVFGADSQMLMRYPDPCWLHELPDTEKELRMLRISLLLDICGHPQCAALFRNRFGDAIRKEIDPKANPRSFFHATYRTQEDCRPISGVNSNGRVFIIEPYPTHDSFRPLHGDSIHPGKPLGPSQLPGVILRGGATSTSFNDRSLSGKAADQNSHIIQAIDGYWQKHRFSVAEGYVISLGASNRSLLPTNSLTSPAHPLSDEAVPVPIRSRVEPRSSPGPDWVQDSSRKSFIPILPRGNPGGSELGALAGGPGHSWQAKDIPGGRPSPGVGEPMDFGPYTADLQRRIKKHWFPPKGFETKRVVVVFKVQSDGTMSNLRLDRSSGVAIADKAALDAVENASPLRPLPEGAPPDVGIQFTFDYNVFSGGGHGVLRQF